MMKKDIFTNPCRLDGEQKNQQKEQKNMPLKPVNGVSSTIQVGYLVERVNSDYKFVGTVVSEFKKTTGLTRYVVEDDRGVLFIWRRENFEKIGTEPS